MTRLYARTATISGGGKAFVFTGGVDGPSGTLPGAFEVDFPAMLGQLAHGFTQSEIQTTATTDDAVLPWGGPLLLPIASSVEALSFLTARADGDFQQRAAGSEEGVNAIALTAATGPGAVLALPFGASLRDPRRALATTSGPAAGGAFAVVPELFVDVPVKKGISVALFGCLTVRLPPSAEVEIAIYVRQAGGATSAEATEYVRRTARNGALAADAIDVPVPLGDLLLGTAITATGLARIEVQWRALSGSPSAVALRRSFGASSIG